VLPTAHGVACVMGITHSAPFFKCATGTTTTNVARAICSSFFEKFKNTILKFQKNLKLNLQVDNVVIYNRANFKVKISYSLSCAKMTNSEIHNRVQIFEISQSVRLCHFCTAQNIRILEFKFYTLVDHIIVNI
jgi:hypothetical protein